VGDAFQYGLNILFFIVWKRINEFFVSKGIEAGLNFYFFIFWNDESERPSVKEDIRIWK